MFARSTTINGDSGAADSVVAYVRDEVMPMLSDMDGCVGLSMMVDREMGRCIATTSWSSEETMKASMSRLSGARMKAAEMMGGRADVAEWEVAVMHREHEAHEGTCCRVTWVEIDSDGLDGVIEFYRSRGLMMLEDMEGFVSSSLFVDRMLGRACSTARFDSRDAMAASSEVDRELRATGERTAGFHVTDVHEFDLAIAHLRVPELA